MYCRMMLMVGEQVVTAAMMIESPKWLSDKGRSAVIYDVPEPEPTHEDTEAGQSDSCVRNTSGTDVRW
jgi:hypothetical protein